MAGTITLTPNQLAAIVQNAVAAAMAAASAYAASAPVIVSSHKKPGKYKGEKGRNFDCFISQREAYWVVVNIVDKKIKVFTALGRLEDKASQWAIELTNCMATNAGALPSICDTWPHLCNLLKQYFEDATPKDRAIVELDKLVDLNAKARSMRDVGQYIAEFNALTARISGLSAKDKEIQFVKGLPNRIYSMPTLLERPPTDFLQWVDRSLTTYAALKRICKKETADRKPAVATSKPLAASTIFVPRFTPRSTAPANLNHMPMGY